MKRVYIAHPLRGDVIGNLAKVDRICKEINETENVCIFSPLHAYAYVSAAGCQKKVLADCIRELQGCDELWVYGDKMSLLNSKGVQLEIRYAQAAGIPIVNKTGLEIVLVPGMFF